MTFWVYKSLKSPLFHRKETERKTKAVINKRKLSSKTQSDHTKKQSDSNWKQRGHKRMKHKQGL